MMRRPLMPGLRGAVCVIGNFSGRNAGDAAILGGLLEDVQRRFPGVHFSVPTINPDFVRRQYAEFPVRPVGLLPWNLSVKILGLPVWRALRAARLVLVTDAILFDRKLLNPLYNYLWTMSLALPAARRRGVPVALYNVSLGPVRTPLGRRCLRRVLDASDIVIVRDDESAELCAQLRPVGAPPVRGADCALNARPADPRRVDALIAEKRLGFGARPAITFNVNSYLDVFLRGQASADAFAPLMAEVMDRAIAELDVNAVVVTTQPMDGAITRRVLSAARRRDRISSIANGECDYRDIAGILGRAELHVGMRTHSLILAAAMGTPVVGLLCTPKNRGFLMSIRQQERMVDFEGLTADRLFGVVRDAWRERARLRAELGPIVAEQKALARAAVELLRPYLEPAEPAPPVRR